ncbi:MULTISPECIES: HU family DNA-binding protein [unclassified Clostridium]|uniref:HU family DNA-binding protein n=1 Tax=unclassified Clostridium TaxID=2614128 RepID=UPI00207945C9|nr:MULTISPECIES: HU family DNA-binding protein [unclassified Clostridium]
MNTNKEGLVLLVKEVFELGTKVEAERKLAELDTLVETLIEILEDGDKIKLGKYIEVSKVLVPERNARNPKTGEEKIVPEHLEMKVKRTTALKNILK